MNSTAQKKTILHLPKVELHCHLDGSVSIDTLKKLAKKEGLPTANLEKAAAPKKCLNLKEYLESFDIILPLLQTKESLFTAAYDVIRQAAAENICYLEIRFAPLLHQQKGLSLKEIITAVYSGINQAKQDFAVHVSLLITALRHHTEEEHKQLIDTLVELNQCPIAGFDFAGDEEQLTTVKLKLSAEHAQSSGLNLTIHSGECGCAQNVIEAVHLGALRIGHGVAIKDNLIAQQLCRTSGVLLELCPSSNLQTNAVKNWAEYPLRHFLKEDIACCINTDNRTISQTTLTREYQLLFEHCKLTYLEMEQLNLHAVNHAFTDEQTKSALRKKIISAYATVTK
ncbi:adenosine deaminase [Enterococcus sp. LJL128]|uniref:adenosine deaminase n=1 Tax=Enterococcus sp. LJL51 TaxID=3416656 RepID=UPI003CFB9FA2